MKLSKTGIVIIVIMSSIVTTAFMSKGNNVLKEKELAIESLDHIAMRVVNFEETVQWYKDVLGFKEDVRWKAPDYIDPNLEFAYLKLADFQLEIAGGGNPEPIHDDYMSIGDTFKHQGYLHMCITVKDIDKTIQVLKRKKIEIFAGPNTNPTLNRKFIHVKDLNGNDIEFVEYLKN